MKIKLIYNIASLYEKVKVFALYILILFCFTDIFAQTIPNYVSQDNLVGWWPFTGNARDSSGNGNHGSVNGASLSTDRFSRFNTAYSFDGNSENSIVFNNKFVFHNSGDASISIWIYPTAITNSINQATYLKSTTRSNIDYNRFNFFLRTSTGLLLDYRSNSPYMIDNLHNLNHKPFFERNKWHHVVYVRISNEYKLYINGRHYNSFTDANPDLPTEVGWVLGNDPVGNFDFAGKLDDLGLWSRALNDCEVYELFKAKKHTPKTAFISSGSDLCSTDSTQLTIANGFKTYLWSNTKTTQNIIAYANQIVSVIATDSYGCRSYDTINLKSIDIQIQDFRHISCFGKNDAWISTAIIGGKSPITYQWNNGLTSSAITNLKKGVYILDVKDANGCKDSISVSILEPDKLLLNLVSKDSASCYNRADGFAKIRAKGGIPNYTFQWNDALNQTDSFANNLLPREYNVIVKDSNSCIDSIQVNILSPPQIKVTINANKGVSCFGADDAFVSVAISGGIPSYELQWDDDNKQTSTTALNLRKGLYTLVIRDAILCYDSIEVLVLEPEKLFIEIATIDSVSCFGKSDGRISTKSSGGTSPYSYLWDDAMNQKTAIASALPKGRYKVIVIDDNACKDSISIELFEPDELKAEIVKIDSVSCYGLSDGSIYATASGGSPGYSYSWSNSQKTEIANQLKKGLYLLTVTDNRACQDTISTFVSESDKPLMVEIYARQYVLKGEVIELSTNIKNPIFNFNWTPLDIFSTYYNLPKPKVKFNTTTLVRVDVSNSSGCKGFDTALIYVLPALKEVIPSAFTPNGDNINDIFTLPEQYEIVQLEIYNRWGELIFKSSPDKLYWDGTFKGDRVQNGSYMYVISAKLKGSLIMLEHSGMLEVL